MCCPFCPLARRWSALVRLVIGCRWVSKPLLHVISPKLHSSDLQASARPWHRTARYRRVRSQRSQRAPAKARRPAKPASSLESPSNAAANGAKNSRKGSFTADKSTLNTFILGGIFRPLPLICRALAGDGLTSVAQ